MESQNPRSDADQHMILRDQFQPVISLVNVQTQCDTNKEDSTCPDSSSSSSTSTSSPDAATAVPEFSFSSDSSSDDFIQVDNPILIFPKPSTTEILLEDEEEDGMVVSNLSELKLEEMFLRSSSTNSRISDVTIESYIPDVSTTQSPPPLQLMGKTTTDFDPERIPASVFGKPASPLDWSVASNESFSIHLGNYSFSHDRVDSTENCYSFKEMYDKSQELTDSNDVSQAKNDSRNTVPRKAKILDEAIVNIPKKSVNDDGFKMKQGGFEEKRDDCKGTEVKVQSFPHTKKGSRYCCCSKPKCCCEWLTCQGCCSCNNRLFSCWPKCCCSPSNWKCIKWGNLCNCFSSCCSSSFCSFRKLFCCFSNRRSRNLQQSNKGSKQDTNNNYCRCCFSHPCCCS